MRHRRCRSHQGTMKLRKVSGRETLRRPCARSLRSPIAEGDKTVRRALHRAQQETVQLLSPTGSELYEIWLKPNLEILGTINNKTFVGLREVVWAFLATSERWEHACEHLEPQIFLVA